MLEFDARRIFACHGSPQMDTDDLIKKGRNPLPQFPFINLNLRNLRTINSLRVGGDLCEKGAPSRRTPKRFARNSHRSSFLQINSAEDPPSQNPAFAALRPSRRLRRGVRGRYSCGPIWTPIVLRCNDSTPKAFASGRFNELREAKPHFRKRFMPSRSIMA